MQLILEAIYASSLLQTVALLMLLLALVDFVTFLIPKIQHIDCKGLLASLGLLGTFWGIFSGLMEFDATNIQASVPKLLNGLKFAFLSSILGMLLATILSLLQMGIKALGDISQQSTISQTPDELAVIVAKEIKTELIQGFQLLASYLQKQNTQSKQSLDDIQKTLQEQNTQSKQSLDGIQKTLQNIYWVLYENRRRFLKLGAHGEELAVNAEEWAAIQDNDSGLIWEHKLHSGLQDAKQRLTWKKPVQDYVQTLNQQKLAGFSDWRLPTADEMRTIISNKGIDQRFFGTLDDPDQSYPFIFVASTEQKKSDQGVVISKKTGATKPGKKAHILLVRTGETG
ncbi:hypothetical protein TI05_04015 [Achromatium sp. WMS3]|nr:hypothetical protein TI05_04015 [Achromatium sp. WMS3]